MVRETPSMVTISTDPTIIVFSTDDLETAVLDLNVDVEVRTETGRWSATFFTLANIEALMRTRAGTGECAGGLYLWAADMIVVRELSYEVIRTAVAQLQRDREFESAFGLLDDDGRTVALRQTPDDGRARLRRHQVQPPHRPIPAPRPSSRQIRMAASHRRPQPAQALAPQHRSAGRLNGGRGASIPLPTPRARSIGVPAGTPDDLRQQPPRGAAAGSTEGRRRGARRSALLPPPGRSAGRRSDEPVALHGGWRNRARSYDSRAGSAYPVEIWL